MIVQKNEVISEEKFFDLGFHEKGYTFYELTKGQTIDNSVPDFYQLYFMLSPDINMHSRSIYTFWDLLGDIGGLFDILRLTIKPIIMLITAAFGTSLETFLVQAIF